MEVINFISSMQNNIILSETGTPCQLEIGFLRGFLKLKHFYLPISLEVPGKEEEPLFLLECRVIKHELDMVLVVHWEELSDDASIPEL